MQLSHNVLPRGLFRAKREVPERAFFVAPQCCLSFKPSVFERSGSIGHRAACTTRAAGEELEELEELEDIEEHWWLARSPNATA